MDILQTPVRFYPDTGGVESYVRSLSSNLVDLGHDVHVVCARTSSSQPQIDSVDGIDVTRLNVLGSIANTHITPTLPSTLYSQAKSADVIHTHLPTPWNADFSAIAGAVTDTPVVLTYHNDIVGEGVAENIAKVYNETALKMTLRLVDRILITQPDYLSNSKHLSQFGSKVDIVRNGVDTSRFSKSVVDPQTLENLGFPKDRDTLFFLSVLDQYHDYKGLDVLLKAMAHLREIMEYPPKLIVGGDGELRERYESLAAELGVEDCVSFIGFISADDLPNAYSAADIFVLPSLSSDQEGFGLVLLEALACETPVITTDVVGISDDVKSQNLGRIVEVNDASALATGIQHELSMNLERKGERGRKMCQQRYSWRQSARKLENIYQNL